MSKIDKFWEVIISWRDSMISCCEKFLQNMSISNSTDNLQKEISSFSDDQKMILKRLFLICIDCWLHDLLKKLQESHDFNKWIETYSDWINIAEESGELNAELFWEKGWIKVFSKYPRSEL